MTKPCRINWCIGLRTPGSDCCTVHGKNDAYVPRRDNGPAVPPPRVKRLLAMARKARGANA